MILRVRNDSDLILSMHVQCLSSALRACNNTIHINAQFLQGWIRRLRRLVVRRGKEGRPGCDFSSSCTCSARVFVLGENHVRCTFESDEGSIGAAGRSEMGLSRVVVLAAMERYAARR